MSCVFRFTLFLFGFIFLSGFFSKNLAQNTGTPEAVVELINDLKLGVQAYGGVQNGRQTVFPLKNRNLKYLQRPVSGIFSYSVPYIGAGVALRFRDAEIAFTVREDRRHRGWMQFEDGSNAIRYSTSLGQSSLQARYLFSDWIGAGVALRGWAVTFRSLSSYEVNGKEVTPRFPPFSGMFRRTLWTLHIPVQKEWKGVRFFGRIGASVYGTGNEEYEAAFVIYQSQENPDQETNEGSAEVIDADEDDPTNAQFARVGAEIPVWRTRVRTQIEKMRGNAPGLSTTWSYDVQLEIGLPF